MGRVVQQPKPRATKERIIPDERLYAHNPEAARAYVARQKAAGVKPSWSEIEWAFMAGTGWSNTKPRCDRRTCEVCYPESAKPEDTDG